MLRVLLACVLIMGLAGSIAAPAFAAGGQVGIIQGTITDTDGKPIAGAAIGAASLTGSYRTVTSARGTFTIVGVIVETYAISVSARGFESYVLRGATVTGDQTLNLPVTLNKIETVIGRAGARSASSAFQPTQTSDSYTISGARIQQTTGNLSSTSLNDVVLAVPGVSLTDSGLPTIRGGSQREIGYQLDGVTFAEPYNGQNGSFGLFSGLNSVQVVEGAGDASQGGIGSGVINAIPKRGTHPGFGSVTFDAGGPNFNHQIQAEYGWANSSGTVSDYIAFNGASFDPYYGYHNSNAAAYGNYFGISQQENRQFVNNFVFKFGKDNAQSLQVLYENVGVMQFGNLGGLPSGTFPGNQLALPYYPFDSLTAPFGALVPGYSQLVGLAPYTPATNVAVTIPELSTDVQTRFLKFEYDNNLSATTYLALRYYNWEQLESDSQLFSLGPIQAGAASYAVHGGPTVGVSGDLTHAFGNNLTVTLNAQYNYVEPTLNYYVPPYGFLTFLTTPALASDFLPGGYVANAFGVNAVRVPVFGANTNNSFFQNYGAGIRVQYNPTEKLRLDFGARYEGQNQHWFNPYNPNNVVNPFDVPSSIWTAAVTNPTVWEPRFALNYLLDPNDSVRFSYGRTAVFSNGQNGGQPLGIYPDPRLLTLAPNLTGATPLLPGAPVANQCGTALNGLAGLFPCANYAQEFYWALDRSTDAPDAGGIKPAVYSNYDASFSHQFGNGLSIKVTPFYKYGADLPSAQLLETLGSGLQVFSGGAMAINRTTGVAINLTTPDRPVGFAGFLSATYQNVLQSAPPLSNGDFNGVPQLSAATLALGDVYRAGYVAPASIRIGGTYTFKNGFSITPIIQIDSGYPYNVGDTIASGGPGSPNSQFGCLPTAPIANYPQVNFGCGVPILRGYQNTSGTLLNTNYADPAYSGSQLNPNIAATRGTPTSSSSGGVAWVPNVEFNLTLQYKHGRDTVGLQMVNLLTNGYNGTTPAVNPFYQPVGNGTSGPNTGQNTCVGGFTTPSGLARGCTALPVNTYAFSNGAYLLTNGNVGFWQLAPLAPTQFNLFYRRQL